LATGTTLAPPLIEISQSEKRLTAPIKTEIATEGKDFKLAKQKPKDKAVL